MELGEPQRRVSMVGQVGEHGFLHHSTNRSSAISRSFHCACEISPSLTCRTKCCSAVVGCSNYCYIHARIVYVPISRLYFRNQRSFFSCPLACYFDSGRANDILAGCYIHMTDMPGLSLVLRCTFRFEICSDPVIISQSCLVAEVFVDLLQGI